MSYVLQALKKQEAGSDPDAAVSLAKADAHLILAAFANPVGDQRGVERNVLNGSRSVGILAELRGIEQHLVLSVNALPRDY